MEGLSPQQKKVFDFIKDYCEKHGISPSIADISTGIGLANSTVYTYAGAMIKKGYLTSEEGVHRSLRIVPEAVPA